VCACVRVCVCACVVCVFVQSPLAACAWRVCPAGWLSVPRTCSWRSPTVPAAPPVSQSLHWSVSVFALDGDCSFVRTVPIGSGGTGHPDAIPAMLVYQDSAVLMADGVTSSIAVLDIHSAVPAHWAFNSPISLAGVLPDGRDVSRPFSLALTTALATDTTAPPAAALLWIAEAFGVVHRFALSRAAHNGRFAVAFHSTIVNGVRATEPLLRPVLWASELVVDRCAGRVVASYSQGYGGQSILVLEDRPAPDKGVAVTDVLRDDAPTTAMAMGPVGSGCALLVEWGQSTIRVLKVDRRVVFRTIAVERCTAICGMVTVDDLIVCCEPEVGALHIVPFCPET
jgi:hypothetical protein